MRTDGLKTFWYGLANFTYLVNFENMGCFVAGDMGEAQTVNGFPKNKVSTTACANHCHKKGFLYFGMKAGGECRCSNDYPGRYGMDPTEAACNKECSHGEGKCGGANQNTAFVIVREVFRTEG